MQFLTAEQLNERSLTKGYLAKQLYGDLTHDTAISQSWLKDAVGRGLDTLVTGNLAGHFVTVHPANGVAYIAPLTADGIKVCAILATVK
jgi:hypothetical protein